MLAHAVFSCISVLTALQAVSARSVLSYNNEVDANSISIDIETNNLYYEYTAGQLMNFSCILKGGLEQYANLSLSIDGAVNKSESSGKRMVSLLKVAEESDNDKYLRCYMWYKGVGEPYIVTRIFTIFYPPRAAKELQNGTYKAIDDFRVGEGANVTVSIRVNPKPYLATWKMNGSYLDSDRFQPWTSDQFSFQNGTWVAGLSISKVKQHDFHSVFQLEVINNQGSTTIPVKMHLQEIDEEPSGWSIVVRLIFLLAIFVALIIIGFICCLALKSRKRFQEKMTKNNDKLILRQVDSTNCSAPQEEDNLQNVITHVPTNDLKEQNYQKIAGGTVIIANELLINAVRAGNEEKVRKLLEDGADVETKIKNGSNSLHIAAQKGFLEIVKLLDEKVEDIDAKNDKNKTALMFATEKGHLEVVKYLLQEWEVKVSLVDDEGNTLLHMAVSSGNFNLVKIFVESIHRVPDLNKTNKKVETALKIADMYGNTDIFAYLQKNGAK